MKTKTVVLYTGTKASCKQFTNGLSREDYQSYGSKPVDKQRDIWRVVATPIDNPSPEEIAAACDRLRKIKQANPSYRDDHDNGLCRVRRLRPCEVPSMRLKQRLARS